MVLGILAGLVKPVTDLISEFVEDPDEAARINAAITAKMLDKEGDLVKAQASIIVAEAQGQSWAQRNWRPAAMLVFVFILLNNYVIVPYANAFGAQVPILEIPPGMWLLLQIGIGGYIAGRTVEKVTPGALAAPTKAAAKAVAGGLRRMRG